LYFVRPINYYFNNSKDHVLLKDLLSWKNVICSKCQHILIFSLFRFEILSFNLGNCRTTALDCKDSSFSILSVRLNKSVSHYCKKLQLKTEMQFQTINERKYFCIDKPSCKNF
jgi:hypothetical protein